MTWSLEGLSLGGRRLRSERFARGLSSYCFATEESATTFLLALGGLKAPPKGVIRHDGKDVLGAPALRAKIALLFANEPESFLGATVAAHLEAVLRLAAAQGVRLTSPLEDEALASFLGTIGAARETRRLAAQERRLLSLAIAMSHDDPLLVALFDPLRDLSPEQFSVVSAWLSERKETETPTLLLTADAKSAERYASSVDYFDDPRPPATPRFSLLVRTERPRDVAAFVSRSPRVHGTKLDPLRPKDLWLFGDDPEEIAASVGAACIETNSDLFELSLSEVRSSGESTRDPA